MLAPFGDEARAVASFRFQPLAGFDGRNSPSRAATRRCAVVADRTGSYRGNVAGAVYRSAVDHAGSNLVLWRWNTRKDDRAQVIDPLAPRNQRSWNWGCITPERLGSMVISGYYHAHRYG